jgi:DNA-binding CsgD family transcriptional regulator
VLLEGSEPSLFSTDAAVLVGILLGFFAEGTEPAPAAVPPSGHVTAVTALPPGGGLSRRELEVLRLVAAGESNRQIARRLGLSSHTVERHVANLYRKIGARGRADATAYALRQGLA